MGLICQDEFRPGFTWSELSQPGTRELALIWCERCGAWQQVVIVFCDITSHRTFFISLLQHFTGLFLILLQLHVLIYLCILHRKCKIAFIELHCRYHGQPDWPGSHVIAKLIFPPPWFNRHAGVTADLDPPVQIR